MARSAKRALKNVSSRVGTTANEKLLDDAVRHAVVLERFKKNEVEAIVGFLDREVVPELVKIAEEKLGKNPTSYAARQVSETTMAASGLLRSSLRVAGERVSSNLGSLAVEEGRYHAAVLGKSMPLGIDMRTPSPELLRQLVETRHMGAAPLRSWFAKLGDDAASSVATQIRIGAASGESVSDIVRRIVGDPDAASAFVGEMAKIKRDASAVVRTAVNHASAQAREASYAANADVIKAVKIVATLDERTTDVCRAQDGKVYPINEGPRPPFHFNCRTTTVPVTKSWRELAAEAKDAGDVSALETLNDVPVGARASMRGEVPASETYGTWLSKQSETFQDEVLGVERAELFRSGRVAIDRFVDVSGKRLTLPQLLAELKAAGGRLPELETMPLARNQSSILNDVSAIASTIPLAPTTQVQSRVAAVNVDDNIADRVPAYYSGTDVSRRTAASGKMIDNFLPRTSLTSARDLQDASDAVTSRLRAGRFEYLEMGIDSLRTPQDYLKHSQLSAYVDQKDVGTFRARATGPVVVLMNGERVVFDGNHKIAAASLNGLKTVVVKLVRL